MNLVPTQRILCHQRCTDHLCPIGASTVPAIRPTVWRDRTEYRGVTSSLAHFSAVRGGGAVIQLTTPSVTTSNVKHTSTIRSCTGDDSDSNCH